MFEIGDRHADERGPYDVLAVAGESLFIQYLDGTLAVLAYEDARRAWRACLAKGDPLRPAPSPAPILPPHRIVPPPPAPATRRRRQRRANVCWFCEGGLSDRTNARCACRWWICRCGACICPDWFDGTMASLPECPRQIERLGRQRYDERIQARRERRRGRAA